ncbi:hypothetical protein H0H92_005801 [Tricholoma furcatifolium]|nr:hypothetical protein H0H92_005801 [Tricholoma furcatifolium]
MPPSFLSIAALFATQFMVANYAAAMPTASASIERRDDGGVALQIWIPVGVIGSVIVFGALALCWRNSISTWFAARRTRRANPISATREITAEQLAGTINGTEPSAGAANRTRRARRARRTPSQISTTSLPAYAKEPGEQELVIFRGPEDMEDAGMPHATIVMEPLSEDGEETLHSRNNSRTSQYPPLPATPVDAPLLQRIDSSGDMSDQLMIPPGGIMARRSIDTLMNSEEESSLAPEYDERGEAPGYFEAIGAVEPTVTTGPPSSPDPVPPRRSGFRTLLHSIPNRFSTHYPSHTRAESSVSAISSNDTHIGRESRASHRPSHSGSGSILSIAPFRTLSRQSNNNLTSPSMISLNSISAPLTHTLTRTEITYPRSGPTPEQVKLISSRETFARFARPYGAEAIAFAASLSQQDLNEAPPPEFDAVPPGSAGPSRLRASSSAAEMMFDEHPSTSASEQDVPAEPATAESSAPASLSRRPSRRLPSTTVDVESHAPNPLEIPLPSSPPESEPVSPSEPEIAPLELPKPSKMAPGALSASFRAPSVLDDFPVSRASSVTTFATAAESLAPRSPSAMHIPSEGDGERPETPSTPRLGAAQA